MSTQALYYRGHAFVAAELSRKAGTVTDEEAEAEATGAALAAIGFLQTHLGEDVAYRALDTLQRSLPPRPRAVLAAERTT